VFNSFGSDCITLAFVRYHTNCFARKAQNKTNFYLEILLRFIELNFAKSFGCFFQHLSHPVLVRHLRPPSLDHLIKSLRHVRRVHGLHRFRIVNHPVGAMVEDRFPESDGVASIAPTWFKKFSSLRYIYNPPWVVK